jgi:hypothetical protein
MKRLPFLIGTGLLLLSCGGEEEEPITGSIMEFEHVDEGYSLKGQPEVVKKFFLLNPEMIGEDFCYDHVFTQELILGDAEEDEWHRYEVDESCDYLLIDNQECYTSLEFKLIKQKKKVYAYLMQSGKNFQRFELLELNKETNRWERGEEIPYPELTTYFDDLSEEETGLVQDHGYQYAYMKPCVDTISFLFSSWQMGMELMDSEVEFEREADREFFMLLEKGEFKVSARD